MKNLKSKKGFTLTELIVVIVIIGILAAVLIPTLTGYIKKANESADQQEVSSLNTLLLDAKINQTEFSSADKLKEYLEKEMDFDGDFSLRTKDDYLWYDTKNYEFKVIGEDEASLFAAETPVWVTSENIKSLEGLLQYSDGSELWIVGGNGLLFDVINEIKEAVNTGSDVSSLNKIKNVDIKEVLVNILSGIKLVGNEGTFVIDENGKTTPSSSSDDTRKDLVVSTMLENVELFHKEVIVKNIEAINIELKDTPVELELGDNYNVKVIIKSNTGEALTDAAHAVFSVVKILKAEGCLYGYIIPSQFANETEYLSALTEIKNAKDDSDTEILSDNLKNILSGDTGFNLDDLESLYKIDLSDIDLNGSTSDLITTVMPILLASLNLYYSDATGQRVYDCRELTNTGVEIFKDKNDIRLFGAIKSEKYGNIKVEYVFKFEVQ